MLPFTPKFYKLCDPLIELIYMYIYGRERNKMGDVSALPCFLSVNLTTFDVRQKLATHCFHIFLRLIHFDISCGGGLEYLGIMYPNHFRIK
jgi:hypothetical protein